MKSSSFASSGTESIFPSIDNPLVKFTEPGPQKARLSVQWAFYDLQKPTLYASDDSARPLLFKSDLENVISEASKHGAAALGVPLKNTIKQIDARGFVKETLDRSTLWEVQTPQACYPSLLKKGFELAYQKKISITDDVSLIELLGYPVKLVEGSYQNLKITTPEDLDLAQTYLSHSHEKI